MSSASNNSTENKGRATLYDVSRVSGVSTATVSRVLTGSAKVSAEIRGRVERAINELGFVPSQAARALAAKRTNTLGVIFPGIASGFYAQVLAGIDEVAAESGFDMLTAFCERRNKPELIKRLLYQGRVDALLILNTEPDNDILESALTSDWPVVLIDRPIDHAKWPAITMDNVGAAEQMIEHLFEQGHRHIAVMTGPKGTYDAERRLEGCRLALSRMGLALPEELILQGDFSIESGERAMRGLLKLNSQLPSAVFCLNDAMAIGAMSALRIHGLDVPGDISIAGFDDVEAAEHLSLTTVACPMRLMGQVAARTALQMVLENITVNDQCLRARLVVRNSSRLSPRFKAANSSIAASQ